MLSQFTQHMTPAKAGFALLLGGAMWGLYWIPVRQMGEMGLPGTWAGLVLYLATLILLSPAIWRKRQNLIENWRLLVVSGAFTGAAFGLWTISLFYTDVVRAILLFYLTPVWSTLIGVAILGERLNIFRVLGLVFGLTGLVVVIGNGAEIPWPRNFGDWLALFSGIAWSLGTTGLYRSEGVSVTGQMFGFLAGGLVVSLLAAALIGSDLPPSVASDQILPVAGFALLTAFYIVPMIWLTIWPATLLSPARVGLLLMSEVVVGIASAALLSGEPFGYREAIGAVLIVGAAVLELSGPGKG